MRGTILRSRETILRSDLDFIIQRMGILCQEAESIWRKAQNDGWGGSIDLVCLSGSLDSLLLIVKDIREEE